MSEAMKVDDVDQGEQGGESDVEARARVLGWKPQAEYKGPPTGWRSAEEFIRRGEEELPVLRERSRATERRLQAVQTDLQQATGVIADLTERFRTADERAYKRARADLDKERALAVETGDTAKFREVEAEIADLETTKPKPAEARRPAAPATEQREEVHPDALAWAAKNPWYHADAQMRNAALAVHQQLLAAEPDLSVSDNLARVTETVRAMFPGRGGAAARMPPVEDNPRRDEPAAVGSGREPSRHRSNARNFDGMPRESKEAYTKYAKAMAGKGKPLTKDEWAGDYWAQFEEA